VYFASENRSSAHRENAYNRNPVNREKKFQCILVIWGKLYKDIQGWQANFELPGRGA
jgi:hypothetical protein